MRCRHTGLKVKTLRCHANWPLRSRSCAAATPALRSKPCVATQTGPKGFKRNPLESCVFLLLEDRGFAGSEWTCSSGHNDRREVPPLRRFPRGGIPTRVKRHAVFHLLLGVTSERDLLAFQPCRFSSFAVLLLPLTRGRLGGVISEKSVG